MALPSRTIFWVAAGLALLGASYMLAISLTRGGRPRPGPAPFTLGLPLDCRFGVDCFVQNYVDHQPGADFRDYTCGPQGYDGHKGTDFRVPTLADMQRGVAVLAVTDGTVLRIRDGMDDTGIPKEGVAALNGREAGNAIVIDPGGGWEIQYGHLRRGSVAVKPGDKVTRGQPLAMVGLSGQTQFPHVHLEIRKMGAAAGEAARTVDPFVGDAPLEECGGPRRPMWSDEAAEALAYRPAAVLVGGLAPDMPEMSRIQAGAYAGPLPADPPAIVAWGLVQGVRLGDHVVVTLLGPGGATLASNDYLADRNLALSFRAAGKKRPPAGWPAGPYTAIITVLRDSEEIAVRRIEVTP